jgi:hypothetical protein
MPKLNTYPVKSAPLAGTEYLLGTDDPSGTPATSNFTADDVAALKVVKYPIQFQFSNNIDTQRVFLFQSEVNFEATTFQSSGLSSVTYSIAHDVDGAITFTAARDWDDLIDWADGTYDDSLATGTLGAVTPPTTNDIWRLKIDVVFEAGETKTQMLSISYLE